MKQHGDGLDALLVGQVAQAGFLHRAGVLAGEPLGLGLEVQLFELVVGDLQEIAKRGVVFSAPCWGRGKGIRTGKSSQK